MSGLPTPKRTLRNEIARHIIEEGYTGVDYMLARTILQDADFAVESLRNYVLVFGLTALIEAL